MNDTKFKKGQLAWNKGLKRTWYSPTEFKKGVSISPATQFKKGEMSEKQKGEKNTMWKGGKPYCIICGIVKVQNRHSKRCPTCFKQTNKAEHASGWKGGGLRYRKGLALTRDNYTCQICGCSDKEVLEVDHIKPRFVNPELELSMENLITLCANCHRRKTNRELRAKLFIRKHE